MNDPAFWRDLREQFESLEQSFEFSADIQDPGPWHLSGGPADAVRRAILQSRFRAFASRGGARATGAPLAAAMDSWLNLLRTRLPHHFNEMTGTAIDSTVQDVQLEQINAPRELDSDGHPVLFVEPCGDRFNIVAGYQHYADALANRLQSITCRVQVPHESTGGFIHHLRIASLEMCEQLETDALCGADSSAPPAATGALNPPVVVAPETLALWLERELNKRTWTVHDLERYNGPSWKTGRKMLAGEKVKRSVLEKTARALSVPLSQIPNH